MKVYKRKKGESFNILGYLFELILKFGDLKEKLFEIWQILVFFFSWKILGIGQNHIFQVEMWRNFTPEKGKNWDTVKVSDFKLRGQFEAPLKKVKELV